MKNLNKTPYFTSLKEALSSTCGINTSLSQSFKLQGGEINKSYGLQLSNGKVLFMKTNEKSKVSLFEAESLSLLTIKNTKTINTPNLIAMGTDNGEHVGYSFLLMDYVELGNIPENFWETFANNLALMHKYDTKNIMQNNNYGFICDNFIGLNKQINTPKEKWIDFFRENRLLPQIKMAESYFEKEDFSKIDKFLSLLDKILIEPEKPSLVHGDLWGGNVLCGTDGMPYLIDPACYIGHSEVDIAMTELFGGFSESFYQSYKELGLIQSEYQNRRDVYNLYHLLNHLNMHGKTYLTAVKSVINSYV